MKSRINLLFKEVFPEWIGVITRGSAVVPCFEDGGLPLFEKGERNGIPMEYGVLGREQSRTWMGFPHRRDPFVQFRSNVVLLRGGELWKTWKSRLFSNKPLVEKFGD